MTVEMWKASRFPLSYRLQLVVLQLGSPRDDVSSSAEARAASGAVETENCCNVDAFARSWTPGDVGSLSLGKFIGTTSLSCMPHDNGITVHTTTLGSIYYHPTYQHAAF
jgi:hypothetical protein